MRRVRGDDREPAARLVAVPSACLTRHRVCCMLPQRSYLSRPRSAPLHHPGDGMVLALLPTHILALVTGSPRLALAGAWTGDGLGRYAWILSRPRTVDSLFS